MNIPPLAINELEISREEIDLSVAGIRKLTPVYLAILVAANSVLLSYVPTQDCVLWTLWGVVHVIAREWMFRKYDSCPPEQRLQTLSVWRSGLIVSALWCGTLWGSAAFLAFAYSSLELKLFWTLVIMALYSLSTPVSAMPQKYALLVTSMPPLVVAWWLWGNSMTGPALWFVGGCALAYLLIGKQHERSNRERIVRALRSEVLSVALERRNNILDASNKSRGALLVSASHDLRQPVQALSMMTALMNPDEPAGLPQRIASVRACVDGLSDMLNQLLEFNRIDLGLHTVVTQPFALNLLLDEVRENFRTIAEQKGLRFTVHAQAVCVATDAQLLRQMLFNLVSNAIQYTPSGYVRVKCLLRDNGVYVTVCDSGIGIAAERMDEIFTEYVRLSDDRAGWEAGLGLGLSIVRKSAALLGQEVTVTSTLGQGSCFTLSLGARLAHVVTPEADIDPLPLRSVPVAVVENDPAVLECLVDIFTAWGCTPVGGLSLAQIECELVRQGVVPALLIADFHLSLSGTGIEVIERLRCVYGDSRLPAILLTGDLDPALEARVRIAGIWIAHKPLRPSRMRRLMEQALTQDEGTVGPSLLV